MTLHAHQLAAIERANRCLAELRAAQADAIEALEAEYQDVRDKLDVIVLGRDGSHADAR